ncbi:MAG: alpha/beta fold hydrolase [Proteobacteria bacterium]|nr:alpha/beta fold hydrolase [Pseudomonadota bacterium]
MTRRRALLFGGAAWLAAGDAAHAQVRGVPPWYATGTLPREVRFSGADGATLSGTLLLPLASEIQPVPGVVLIAGSGPTDRDGNTPLIPARIDTLKLIAARLAAAGIATLRYDKRGVGRSSPPPEGLAAQERFFQWDHAVADAVAAHTELLRHDEIKSYATAFLGHSEGGLLALAALAGLDAKKRPHALVLASTPAGRWPTSCVPRSRARRRRSRRTPIAS